MRSRSASMVAVWTDVSMAFCYLFLRPSVHYLFSLRPLSMDTRSAAVVEVSANDIAAHHPRATPGARAARSRPKRRYRASACDRTWVRDENAGWPRPRRARRSNSGRVSEGRRQGGRGRPLLDRGGGTKGDRGMKATLT